jgi:large subunit ribosomal protein L35
MAKAKTNKSAAARFRVTKNGKVLRRVAFGRHLRRKKSARQLRGYGKSKLVGKTTALKIKRRLGLA